MYVIHKPGAEHDAWHAKKDLFKMGGLKEHTVTPKVPTPANTSTDSSAAKFSLSKSLQAAVVNTLQINFRRSGQMVAMSLETRWPRM